MTSRIFIAGLWSLAATSLVAAAAFAWLAPQSITQADISEQRLASLPTSKASSAPAVTFGRSEPPILELMSRSPFDEARRPFERTMAEPPPPPIPPRLIGISTVNGVRSALVEWRPSGEIQRLVAGMETAQGVVGAIGESDLTLKSAAGEVKISMYE